MQRPDFSNYVAHFTKDADPCGNKDCLDNNAAKAISGNAYERLISILKSQKIHATPMPWTGAQAVAFTECPWWSMLHHAEAYSPYGVGFTKPHLFAAGGGPAIYLRPDLYNIQGEFVHKDHPELHGFHSAVHAFITPFAPPYAPKKIRDDHWNRGHIDYSHEREWRVPHDFTFDYDEVQFVVVKTYEDMAKIERELKNVIGREKFLIMDIHREIERLWPTHVQNN
ncbi:MAG: terminase [Armatimonadetes bacterium]|nr:terminase [Armatimonadota bacterium]